MDVKATVNKFIIDELEEGNVARRKTWNTIQVSAKGRQASDYILGNMKAALVKNLQ